MAHIMVVDDERDVVSLVQFLLEKDGYRVTPAYHGGELLEKLGIEPPDASVEIPDLIVIDVMMPVMDGYSACARLAATRHTQSIPIIVLTAKGEMRDLFSSSPNVSAYIDKPFDPKSLRELIARTLVKGAGARNG